MLMVRTILKQSDIDGLGLFADEDIPAGTIVWVFSEAIDRLLTHQEVSKLPMIAREFIQRYAYLDGCYDRYVLCGDDARFMNHSDAPNTHGIYPMSEPYGIDAVVRDIKAGEELTCDYRAWDVEHEQKLVESTGGSNV